MIGEWWKESRTKKVHLVGKTYGTAVVYGEGLCGRLVGTPYRDTESSSTDKKCCARCKRLEKNRQSGGQVSAKGR